MSWKKAPHVQLLACSPGTCLSCAQSLTQLPRVHIAPPSYCPPPAPWPVPAPLAGRLLLGPAQPFSGSKTPAGGGAATPVHEPFRSSSFLGRIYVSWLPGEDFALLPGLPAISPRLFCFFLPSHHPACVVFHCPRSHLFQVLLPHTLGTPLTPLLATQSSLPSLCGPTQHASVSRDHFKLVAFAQEFLYKELWRKLSAFPEAVLYGQTVSRLTTTLRVTTRVSLTLSRSYFSCCLDTGPFPCIHTSAVYPLREVHPSV